MQVGFEFLGKERLHICEVGGCSREHHVFVGKYKLLQLKPLIWILLLLRNKTNVSFVIHPIFEVLY